MGMKEEDQPFRNRSISFKSTADIKKIFGQVNIKESRKRNYDFNLETKDYELYLEKVNLIKNKKYSFLLLINLIKIYKNQYIIN